MHDMHTNTMHHAWCNAWYKGNTQPQCINIQNNAKNKRNVTKTCKNSNFAINNGVQKNHGNISGRTKRGPQRSKGSLKTRRTPQNKTGNRTKRDARHTIYVMGATPPPPSGREHPEGLPIPPYPVENPVDNFGNPDHNVTAIMWKTPKPVENPVENSVRT